MRLKIPRILHGIWLGGEIPEELQGYRDTWNYMMPNWKQILWTEENIPELQNQDLYDDAKTYAEKSDIARLEILRDFGGVYADMDYSCQQPIYRLIWDYDFFIVCDRPVWVENHDRYGIPYLNNAFMGCTPQHPLIEILVDKLPDFYEKNRDDHVCMKTGPGFVSIHLYMKDFLTLYNNDLRGRYATHHFANSWKEDEPQRKGWPL